MECWEDTQGGEKIGERESREDKDRERDWREGRTKVVGRIAGRNST